MSELDEIKARLEAARGLAWHSYRLTRYEDGRVDYAVAPSPLERTHFSKGDVEFMVAAREDMAKLLAVVEAIRKDWTPAIMAEAARTTASHMTGKGREEWLELAAAWDGLAEKLEAIEAE